MEVYQFMKQWSIRIKKEADDDSDYFHGRTTSGTNKRIYSINLDIYTHSFNFL